MLLDVYSDAICPWCYIGKRRLDKVMETSAGEGVEVHWRAFQLYPTIPAEGVDRDAYMKARFGDDRVTASCWFGFVCSDSWTYSCVRASCKTVIMQNLPCTLHGFQVTKVN